MNKVTICFFLCAFALKVSAQQNSYIQVKAEPDISVFLNHEFKGKTNLEYNGLIIEKLKAGSYRIKVVKDGFSPQTETIILNPGEVKIYRVKPFVPQYRISQSGNKQQQTIQPESGSLRIQSLPVEIQIEIIDLNIKSSKSEDQWNIEDIPIGVHNVKFTWGNKVLSDTIRIEQGVFRHVFADLVNGKVEIRPSITYQEDYNEKIRLEAALEKRRIDAEFKNQNDILNRTRNALSNVKSEGNNSNVEWITGHPGNHGISTGSVDSKVQGEGGGLGDNGISFDLGGRGFQKLPPPKYDYHGEGRVVVEVSIDRSGRVVQATPGVKGSTTLDEYLLRVSKEAALEATFEMKSNAPSIQKGTLTYNFKLK